MVPKRNHAQQRPKEAQQVLSMRLRFFPYVLSILMTVICLLNTQEVLARCLIAAEESHSLSQGDVIVDLAGIGGSQGGGYALGGRLGLVGMRELQLKFGGCQREIVDPRTSDSKHLWGNGFSFGLKQTLLTTEMTSSIELSTSLRVDVLDASDGEEKGNSYTSLGVMPFLLLSYPFAITADREGFLTFTLGAGAQFVDQTLQDSQLEFAPILGLSGGAEILPFLSLRGVLNWQDDGFYGGASVAYRF